MYSITLWRLFLNIKVAYNSFMLDTVQGPNRSNYWVPTGCPTPWRHKDTHFALKTWRNALGRQTGKQANLTQNNKPHGAGLQGRLELSRGRDRTLARRGAGDIQDVPPQGGCTWDELWAMDSNWPAWWGGRRADGQKEKYMKTRLYLENEVGCQNWRNALWSLVSKVGHRSWNYVHAVLTGSKDSSNLIPYLKKKKNKRKQKTSYLGSKLPLFYKVLVWRQWLGNVSTLSKTSMLPCKNGVVVLAKFCKSQIFGNIITCNPF